MKPVFLSCLAVCVLLPPKVHKFEDGFVERTMAVVIRDRTVNVNYSFGLNQNTLKQVLDSWESEPIHSEPWSLERASSPTQLSDPPTAKQESAVKEADIDSDQFLIPEPPESSRASLPDPAGVTLPDPMSVKDPILKQKLEVAVTGPSAQPQDEGGNSQDELGHVIDAKLFEELQTAAPANISKRITISCNGQALKPSSASIGPAPRHPFSLAVRIEFELPDAHVFELKFSDMNFPDQTGAARYALKTKGRSVILRSDAAPILIRSERVELESLKKRNSVRTTISAKVAVLPQTNQ